MAVTVKKAAVSTKTYKIAGKTLADLNAEMKKKGPVDLNDKKRYSGSCLGALAIGLPQGKSVTLRQTSEADPVEFEATLNGTVSIACVITMPSLVSDKALGADAKKEWKRFLAAVEKHENGHVDAYVALAEDVARTLNGMKTTGTGADKRAAAKAAIDAMFAEVSALYPDDAALKELVKKCAEAYDDKTRHGGSQGAVLDGTIA